MKTKGWLATATICMVAGLILLVATLTACKGEDSMLFTGNYETNTHEVTETFHNLLVDTDTADVTFAPSTDGKCRVVCYEDKKAKHSVAVWEDTLTIKLENEKAWYEYIGINFRTPQITVYLPQTQYAALTVKSDTGDVEVQKNFSFDSIDISLDTGDIQCYASATHHVSAITDTGDITVKQISAGSLDLSTSTGWMKLSDINCTGDISLQISTGFIDLAHIQCHAFSSTGDTGDLTARSLIATGTLTIERSTGDIRLESSDAAELFLTTDTGDVTGSLLSEKVFLVRADTGDIDVPKTITGGRCEITTDTGDVEFDVIPA